MMVKAAIIAAAAAGSLVAVSPLAFAGDYDGGNGHHKGHHSKSHHDNDHRGDWRGNRGGGDDRSCEQNTSADSGRGRGGGGGGGGLLNITGNAIQVPVQACNNNILNNIGLGVLGSGRANQR